MLIYCKLLKCEVLDEADCYHCKEGYGCNYWCGKYIIRYDKEFLYCIECEKKCTTEINTKEYLKELNEWFVKNQGGIK